MTPQKYNFSEPEGSQRNTTRRAKKVTYSRRSTKNLRLASESPFACAWYIKFRTKIKLQSFYRKEAVFMGSYLSQVVPDLTALLAKLTIFYRKFFCSCGNNS